VTAADASQVEVAERVARWSVHTAQPVLKVAGHLSCWGSEDPSLLVWALIRCGVKPLPVCGVLVAATTAPVTAVSGLQAGCTRPVRGGAACDTQGQRPEETGPREGGD
jgi:hypothetical protein